MHELVFTAHNIELLDGRYTMANEVPLVSESPWLKSAKKLLNSLFPADKSEFSLVDLGCLEGGYALEFAKMGFQTMGIEAKQPNIDCCRLVQESFNLANLSFEKDDVLNISNYENFDVAFCCGLLYHLENPKLFLEKLTEKINGVLILNTHFSLASPSSSYNLSRLEEHENLSGRWFKEFDPGVSLKRKEESRWASHENENSFWVLREDLIQVIYDLGFDIVLEEFDNFAPNVSGYLKNEYSTTMRGTFIGIRSEYFSKLKSST